MKLSEALREGRKTVKRQIEGEFLSIQDGELCGCVLGTIAVGAGFKSKFSDLPGYCVGEFLAGTFPQLAEEVEHWPVEASLVGLNDNEHKTFDELQTWLEEKGL